MLPTLGRRAVQYAAALANRAAQLTAEAVGGGGAAAAERHASHLAASTSAGAPRRLAADASAAGRAAAPAAEATIGPDAAARQLAASHSDSDAPAAPPWEGRPRAELPRLMQKYRAELAAVEQAAAEAPGAPSSLPFVGAALRGTPEGDAAAAAARARPTPASSLRRLALEEAAREARDAAAAAPHVPLPPGVRACPDALLAELVAEANAGIAAVRAAEAALDGLAPRERRAVAAAAAATHARRASGDLAPAVSARSAAEAARVLTGACGLTRAAAAALVAAHPWLLTGAAAGRAAAAAAALRAHLDLDTAGLGALVVANPRALVADAARDLPPLLRQLDELGLGAPGDAAALVRAWPGALAPGGRGALAAAAAFWAERGLARAGVAALLRAAPGAAAGRGRRAAAAHADWFAEHAGFAAADFAALPAALALPLPEAGARVAYTRARGLRVLPPAAAGAGAGDERGAVAAAALLGDERAFLAAVGGAPADDFAAFAADWRARELAPWLAARGAPAAVPARDPAGDAARAEAVRRREADGQPARVAAWRAAWGEWQERADAVRAADRRAAKAVRRASAAARDEAEWPARLEAVRAAASAGGDIEGGALGRWLGRQRAAGRLGALAPERRAALEALPRWSWRRPTPEDAAWHDARDAVAAHAAAHGRAPLEDDPALGAWVVEQRALHAGDVRRAAQRARRAAAAARRGEPPPGAAARARPALAPERAAALERTPGWTWVELGAWGDELGRLRLHAAAHGGPLTGAWAARQREARRRGALAPERAAALEGVPGWAWDEAAEEMREAEWEAHLGELREAAAARGAIPPASALAPHLARWLSNQRQYASRSRRLAPGFALSPARLAALEALPGWTWTPREARWRARLAELRAHVAARGRLPRGAGELASWVKLQLYAHSALAAGRRTWRTLSPARRAALEAVPGWTWDLPDPHAPREAARFAARLARLRAVAGELGRLPPRAHPSGLGSWVRVQRAAKRAADAGRPRPHGAMTPERAAALEAVPFWTWGGGRGGGRPRGGGAEGARGGAAAEDAARVP
jgi:hypothetical protein